MSARRGERDLAYAHGKLELDWKLKTANRQTKEDRKKQSKLPLAGGLIKE